MKKLFHFPPSLPRLLAKSSCLFSSFFPVNRLFLRSRCRFAVHYQVICTIYFLPLCIFH